MIRAILSVAVLMLISPAVWSADPCCVPVCKCGCSETGKCACKSCNEHTADPNWKPCSVNPTYGDCFAAVAKGVKTVLYVGVKAPAGAYYTESVKGFAPGIYNCWLEGNTPTFQPQPSPQTILIRSDMFGFPTGGPCVTGNCGGSFGVGYPILMGGGCSGGSCAGGTCYRR